MSGSRSPRIEVKIESLESNQFAPFGHVIDGHGSTTSKPSRVVNQGYALRVEQSVQLVDSRPQARLVTTVYECQPRPRLPLEVLVLERHPCSPQVFVPMQECEFIVIVARGSTEPDFESIRAFRARPGQGICYHAGTWHHPMVAQIQTTSFFVLTYEDGSKLDCEEFQVVPQQVFVVETSG